MHVAAPTPRSRRATSGDGTEVAYRVHGGGDRPWVVLTNGAGCSEEFWTTALIPACVERVRLVEWHYRGHYASSPAPDPRAYRVEDHAADLLAVLDAEGIAEAVFVGFSLGVQVTLEAYRRRPGAFRALCLISGSCEDPLRTFAGRPELRPLLCALFDLGARLPRLTARVTRFALGGPLALPVARWSRFVEEDAPAEPVRAYLHKAARLAPVPYMRTLRLMGEHSARDVLPAVRVPTLLVVGLEDAMTPAAVMRGMRDALVDVEWLPVREGRHTMLISRGAWIANRLLEFLERRGLLPPVSDARTAALAARAR